MKLLCKTSDLLQSLTLVSRAISGQQALPILGNILLEAEGKRCKVSATELTNEQFGGATAVARVVPVGKV